MSVRRIAALALLGAGVVATPASAHGLGSRGDLPIPKNFFIWAATLAVVMSFLIAAVMWQSASLRQRADGHVIGRTGLRGLRTALSPIIRTLALVAFAIVLIAAWGGERDPNRNIAPVVVYIVVWAGLLWLSAILGDIWRMLNPWDTLAMYGSGRIGMAPEPQPDDGSLVFSYWPAAVGLGAFQWLELAHPDPSDPRVLAVAITLYTVVVLACAARWGRVWLQTGEGVTVLFRLVASMAPIGRRPDGRLVLRWPVVGLSQLEPRRGMAAVVVTVIGGTTFDGISRSRWFDEGFRSLAGWDRALLNTAGLVVTIALVALGYLAATALVSRIGGGDSARVADRFASSLVPIALAYSVAHYFSLAVFDGQGAWRLLSDPFGQGWDLFGTATAQTDYRVVGTTTIALVQTAAIVIGHVAAVIVAHDRAVRDYGTRRATASQIPLLALMIGLTVTGLTLLLSA